MRDVEICEAQQGSRRCWLAGGSFTLQRSPNSAICHLSVFGSGYQRHGSEPRSRAVLLTGGRWQYSIYILLGVMASSCSSLVLSGSQAKVTVAVAVDAVGCPAIVIPTTLRRGMRGPPAHRPHHSPSRSDKLHSVELIVLSFLSLAQLGGVCPPLQASALARLACPGRAKIKFRSDQREKQRSCIHQPSPD